MQASARHFLSPLKNPQCFVRFSSSVATKQSPPILRYFESRGRAQALRYTLADSGVEWVDEKVSFHHIFSGNWMNLKHNERFSGPFGTLPILQWGSFTLSQTEAIAMFLYHRLGHGGAPATTAEAAAAAVEREALSASITSMSHQDVINVCIQLVGIVGNMQGKSPDSELSQPVHQCMARVNNLLPRLERMLAAQDGGYFLGDQPATADFFVWEALDVILLVFGPHLIDTHQGLAAFRTRMMERPKLKAYLVGGKRPLLLTGLPAEAEALARIRAILKT